MGADLFKADADFRSLVAVASELVGDDLESICLRGPENKLTRPRVLQPLLAAVSLGYLRRLLREGVQPDLVLGHSLGEITGLAAAGIITPTDALRIAVKRGELMDEAARTLDGGMLAVTVNNRTPLLEWLASPDVPDGIVLANDNAPTQVVLSGTRTALTAGAQFIGSHRLGKCRFLAVSGPWHSPSMANAAALFDAWLRQIPWQPPQVPMLLNMTSATATTPEEIRSAISGALTQSVRWTACMAALAAMNPRCLLEVGPGRVLSGLARANGFGNEVKTLNVSNLRGVELAAQLGL